LSAKYLEAKSDTGVRIRKPKFLLRTSEHLNHVDEPQVSTLDARMSESAAEINVQSLPGGDLRLVTRHPRLFEHGPDDATYLDFFLKEAEGVVPYFQIFSGLVGNVFCRSTTDQALYHTVLSLSHVIVDHRLERSLLPACQHQIQALSRLQKSISTKNITEAVVISVAMLAWLGLNEVHRSTTNHHLNGLYMIFQELQKLHLNGAAPSELLMQMWHISVRIDIIAGIFFFPRQCLFTPVAVDQDHVHRDWIQ